MPKSSNTSPHPDRRFARALLAWYARHGRRDLPWKRSGDPYHVWVSEIMLQQTQVATVIPYFERFIARFPTVTALARADLNAVLHLWSGLGYYARARNLHHAARLLARDHGGRLPERFERLHALPGIGRSTAGAILALAYGERHPILDGNVRRVLARYHAIAEPLAGKTMESRLWALAEAHTPKTRVAEYTQAIMDLGATLCRRTRPECARCPVRAGCAAHRLGTPERFPAARRRRPAPVRPVRMLLIRDARERVLLVRRPPAGIWGGLWGLPECTGRDVSAWCRRHLGLTIRTERALPKFRHTFSHFHLDITPIPARLVGSSEVSMESAETVWYNVRRPDARGLAAPVQRLLESVRASRSPASTGDARPVPRASHREGRVPGRARPARRGRLTRVSHEE